MATRKPLVSRPVCISGVLAFLLFAGFQLVPVERANPPAVQTPEWDSPRTRDLARRACFDCHSHETRWPWYAYIATASWLVTDDVNRGREAFNFSKWNPRVMKRYKVQDIVRRVVGEGRMPPGEYRWLHQDARLTEAEKTELIEGLQRTIVNAPTHDGSETPR